MKKKIKNKKPGLVNLLQKGIYQCWLNCLIQLLQKILLLGHTLIPKTTYLVKSLWRLITLQQLRMILTSHQHLITERWNGLNNSSPDPKNAVNATSLLKLDMLLRLLHWSEQIFFVASNSLIANSNIMQLSNVFKHSRLLIHQYVLKCIIQLNHTLQMSWQTIVTTSIVKS